MSGLRRLSLWQWLVAAVTVLSVIYFVWCEPASDDLAYARALGGVAPTNATPWLYLKWNVAHWLSTNGRWGNYAMPLLAVSPVWLRAAACAFMAGAMYCFAVLCSGTGRSWVSTALVFGCCVVLPWWDSFQLLACQTNYVWGSAAILAAWWVIFRTNVRPGFWACLLALVGGCSHEAGALPVACAYIGWLVLLRRRPDARERRLAAWFGVGVALTVCSPALWSRFVTMQGGGQPDDPALWLFLKSDAAAGVLWLVWLCCACTARGRQWLVSRLHSPLAVMALATVPAAAVSVAGGVVGRSGWYATLYALIVLASMLADTDRRRRLGLGLVFAALTLVQLVGTDVWQWRLGREHREFVRAYADSADGIVAMEPTPDDAQPWWTLWKARGVPDADDEYLYETMRLYWRTDGAWPVAMPAAAVCGLHAHREVDCGGYGRLVAALPEGSEYLHKAYHTLYHYWDAGTEYMVTPVQGMYWVTRRVNDPGDRDVLTD